MPKNDPDAADPLELQAVCLPDPGGEAARSMAECFAEEFLRLGHAPAQVLALFRSEQYPLAHHALLALGDDAVRAIVEAQARVWARSRRRNFPV